MRNWLIVGIVSAAVVGGGIWAEAQAPHVPEQPQEIISGADIGFRVDRWDGDTPVGRIVVRHDGQWVEVRLPVSPRRLTVR